MFFDIDDVLTLDARRTSVPTADVRAIVVRANRTQRNAGRLRALVFGLALLGSIATAIGANAHRSHAAPAAPPIASTPSPTIT